jgi:hypothetical protein
MLCTICYNNDINNNINCRVCKNSVCNNCFSNILLTDDNFRICIIYNIPIIYRCSFCKTENRLRNFNNEIQHELIEILENKLNIKQMFK